MKKETLKDIFKRSLTKDAMNLIFIKPEEMINYTSQPTQQFKPSTSSPENQVMQVKNSFGIKIQSVALPIGHLLFTLKTEEGYLDWMRNTIHSQYTAYFEINKKYNEDAEQISWNNNKVQNQRFLETSGR